MLKYKKENKINKGRIKCKMNNIPKDKMNNKS